MSFISYSQNGEDVLLWRALGHLNPGFYIDVGANDPVADSVTKAFYDAGWHGINIEPLPAFHQALQAQRPRDINLGVAAGARAGSVTLFDVPAKIGWASPDAGVAAAHRADGFAVAELTVPMVTLSSVCALYAPADIHFLKIDVEGFEAEVLRGLDLARWRPWVLVIEATVPNSRVANHTAWEALVTGRGYRYTWFDGLNRYYVASEHAALAASLALQPNVFDDAISYHLDSARKAGAAAHQATLDARACTERAAKHCARETARAEHEAARARHEAARADRQAALATQEAARATLEGLRAELACKRQQDAERRAEQAGQAARQAQLQLDATRHQNAQLQAALAQLRSEADTQSQNSAALQAWAGELERQLLATRRSTSWRVTAPLRLAGAIPRRLRAAMRHALLRASANERLRRLLIPVLLRFPGQAKRVSRVLATIRQPAPPPAAGATPELPEELRAMPAKARRVLDDLQRAQSGND